MAEKNEYTPINLGAIDINKDERFKLVDKDNRVYKYVGEKDFEGQIVVSNGTLKISSKDMFFTPEGGG